MLPPLLSEKSRSNSSILCVALNPKPSSMSSGTMGEDINEDLGQVSHICCFGASYDGILSMAVMAQYHPEITFKIVDMDQDLIKKWEGGEILFYEPEFEELIGAVRGKNLFFCEEMNAAINEAAIVFVAVDVPVGPTNTLDLTDWEFAIQKIIGASTTRKIIVEKSMPFIPRNWTEEIIRYQNPLGLKFSVFSNPDFILQGTAVRDLRDPKRVVIARNHGHEEDVLRLKQLYSGYVPVKRIQIVDDHKTAALGKLWSSVYPAMMHTFGNVIPSICDSIGADSNDVERVIGCANSENYMDASIGFGGPVIQDISYLKSVLLLHCNDCIRPDRLIGGLKMESDLLNQIIKLNEEKKKRFVKLMLNKTISLSGMKIAVFGISYKKDTDDIRDSPAIYICKALLEEGCKVRIFDPRVNENTIRNCFDLKVKKNKLRNRFPKTLSSKLCVCTTMPEAWSKADAVVFLVNWDEFQQIDFEAMYREMKGWPRFMFVGCKSGLDYNRIKTLGFELYVDGRHFV
uniref:UDP-glucose 6-dehydrogenase 4-like n=1 Tax=Fragaria vesca subsp. vesca TaxID=101020 RepID=UPI0005C93378|nr:PREDICTED: UDP-glucose 6-dehydrogenase 4-like [Fragaria vesca subsp. vesca]